MIPYFIPDMPTTDQLIPYLRKIDTNRWYSNFGPLYDKFRLSLAETLFSGIDPDRIALVSSGTSAIELALKSLALPAGSKVLTSCFTFPATIEAIINVGLTPVICEIDKDSWLLTPDLAQLEIAQQDIAAVVPVAAFGMPICSESWSHFHKNTGLPVVVDAAAAIINQSINDKLIYAFSLHATKTIGAGEGGLVVCPNKNQATLIKKLSNFGIEPNRKINHSGANAKISEYHCAVGLAQLDRLNEILNKRNAVFDFYLNTLNQAQLPMTLQSGVDQYIPASLYAVFESTSAKRVSHYLQDNGIETRRLYYPLINKHRAFTNISIAKAAVPKHALMLSEQGLALPFHMHLSHEEIELVVSKLSNLLLT